MEEVLVLERKGEEQPSIPLGITPEEHAQMEEEYLVHSFRGRCPGCNSKVALEDSWLWAHLVQRAEERMRPVHNRPECLKRIGEVAFVRKIEYPTPEQKAVLERVLGEG